MGIIFVPLANFFIQYLDTLQPDPTAAQRLARSADRGRVLQPGRGEYRSAQPGDRSDHLRAAAIGLDERHLEHLLRDDDSPARRCLLLKWDEESVGSGAGSDTIDSVEYLVNAGDAASPARAASRRRERRSVAARRDPRAQPARDADGDVFDHLRRGHAARHHHPHAERAERIDRHAGTSVTLTGQRRQSSS